MNILYDEKRKLFHLQTPNTSYILGIHGLGWLTTLYYGPKLHLKEENLLVVRDRAFSPYADLGDKTYSPDTLPLELGSVGGGDFRVPSVELTQADGSSVTEFFYKCHKIVQGKPALDGQPAVYTQSEDEAMTLIVTLEDAQAGARAELYYTVFRDFDAICRRAVFINTGKQELKLERALSCCFDLPTDQYDFVQLSGAWARERHVHRTPLRPGSQLVESVRGTSSHQQSPFIALAAKNADEKQGRVYGAALIYSGNFVAQAEVSQFSTTRVVMGINPNGFSWQLDKNASFETPEAVLVCSAQGFGGMSRCFNKLIRTRLCRGKYRDGGRPVLLNSWEGCYFNFTADTIVRIGRDAAKLGIELLVMDDGWFGKRDDDHTSLGDWTPYPKKLPRGLKGLADELNAEGIAFGLWLEPEMVSPDSDLNRAHPDWALQVPGRVGVEGRNQLVLDYTRADVRDYIVSTVNGILASANIAYVKWDMNRHLTHACSALLSAVRQGETFHRFVLGVYDVMERITSANPEVLFEGCSGGGGRFDGGILYYMPQIWCSDDSDAIERLYIQHGTSLVYPQSAISAHVSAVPNHQVQRVTPLATRGAVAFTGAFGYELNVGLLPQEKQKTVAEQVQWYKDNRDFLASADYYRLRSPFGSNASAWMFLAEDKSRALVQFVRKLNVPNEPLDRLLLDGLAPDAQYRVAESGEVWYGDALMELGLPVCLPDGDFTAQTWTLTRVDE